jgi:hypothetical protein
MKYIEEIDLNNKKHIIIDNGDGSFKSFPADTSNPEYLSFIGESETPKVTEPEEE